MVAREFVNAFICSLCVPKNCVVNAIEWPIENADVAVFFFLTFLV